MTKYELSSTVKFNMKQLENLASSERDIDTLRLIYAFVADLRFIDIQLNTLTDGDRAGRKIADVKARDKLEALAALDILRSRVSASDYQSGQRVEESVYMTKEGSVWGG